MNKGHEDRCQVCGAVWTEDWTCETAFHQMLIWEFADEGGAGAVHHLSVLCYHIQHPQMYSPQGLRHAIDLLAAFEAGATPEEVRAEAQAAGERTWRIKGSASTGYGSFRQPMTWKLTTPMMVIGGTEGYTERVRAWASSVLATLIEVGER